jgi:hypothetical protein
MVHAHALLGRQDYYTKQSFDSGGTEKKNLSLASIATCKTATFQKVVCDNWHVMHNI